jgi:putative Holliday junction resolvase
MSARNILALDIGSVRIGVARVNTVARIPEVLPTISNNENTVEVLQKLITDYEISLIVVGLPRSMEGTETAQSNYVRIFCDEKLRGFGLPIELQDETLTSVVAIEQLEYEGALSKKGDIDGRAAAILVNDYIENHEV